MYNMYLTNSTLVVIQNSPFAVLLYLFPGIYDTCTRFLQVLLFGFSFFGTIDFALFTAGMVDAVLWAYSEEPSFFLLNILAVTEIKTGEHLVYCYLVGDARNDPLSTAKELILKTNRLTLNLE